MTRSKKKGKSKGPDPTSAVVDGKSDNDPPRNQPVFPWSTHIFPKIIQHLVWIIEDSRMDFLFRRSRYSATKKDLKNCALVCRAFSALCRPHIFGSVSLGIGNKGSEPSLAQLSSLIMANPSLATYIKDVSCEFVATRSTNVKDVPGLPIIFRLPNIHTLAITTDESANELVTRRYKATQNANLAWRTTLDLFAMSQNLTQITLANSGIHLFSTCSRLPLCRRSSCEGVIFPDLSPSPAVVSRPRASDSNASAFQSYCPDLEEVEFFEVESAEQEIAALATLCVIPYPSFRKLSKITSQGGFNLSDICNWAGVAGLRIFPALKSISVNFTDENEIPGLNELFTFAPLLESLEITNSREIATRFLNLQPFIRVCRFTLKNFWMDYTAESMVEAEGHVQAFCDILTLVRKDNILEEITLRIDGVYCNDVEMLRPRSVNQWEHFQNMILERDNFPHLREVVVCFEPFVSSTTGNTDNSPLESYLNRVLKGLFTTKRFDFKGRVNMHWM
ncbi:hypothetical protein BJ165DRAFT_1452436 [Panaeolus papilionaceus]|nr:hypothetical protein BJ165DRAFT_1452436 [Panaeolus papilionaceus]